jgi:hypothetical protein
MSRRICYQMRLSVGELGRSRRDRKKGSPTRERRVLLVQNEDAYEVFVAMNET